MGDYDEGYRQGASGNPLYVPTGYAIDGHRRGQEERQRQQAAARTRPPSYEITPITWEQAESLRRLFKITLLVCAVAGSLFWLVVKSAEHFMPDGRYAGKTVYYNASQLSRFYEIPWMSRGKVIPLDYQKSIVINGNLNRTKIDAYWDVTVHGNVTDSSVSSRIGSVVVENAKDSVLIGRHILVKGTTENVTQRITHYP